MRPRLWAAVLIFFSGYSPLLLILSLRDFDFKTAAFAHPRTAASLIAIAATSVLLIFVALRLIRGGVPIRVLSTRSRATDLVNYSLPYIVSFFGLKLDDPHDMISLAVLMLLLFILAFRTKALFINPILACAGYQLLEAEYEDSGQRKSKDLLVKGEITPGDVCRAEVLSTSLLLITSNESNNETFRTIASATEVEEDQSSPSTCDLVASP